MELIRWDVYAAVVAPKVFPTSCPVTLPEFDKPSLPVS